MAIAIHPVVLLSPTERTRVRSREQALCCNRQKIGSVFYLRLRVPLGLKQQVCMCMCLCVCLHSLCVCKLIGNAGP